MTPAKKVGECLCGFEGFAYLCSLILTLYIIVCQRMLARLKTLTYGKRYRSIIIKDHYG